MAKAAPIARPSRDYSRKLQDREAEYGDTELKLQREQARLREIQERQRAREAGREADLGHSGAIWEKVASTGATSSSSGRGAGGGGGGAGGGTEAPAGVAPDQWAAATAGEARRRHAIAGTARSRACSTREVPAVPSAAAG
eukprot:CAMPEP_0175772660 /NCGR_PEP_ID=MMETSP0097-20121207/72667_1 /TAXON_ID=311494 /ORGANISM="Alexandrium monilatum, Strain CCMP3105" /LENGTH=140 /DNA_ID=CAMNT_0017083027 /DNA_START=65 /DNA_END=484 /DNA_ORIENTATION=-